MPRNRRPVDRGEKLDEIVVAAADLFTEVGFEESSMAKVAAAAGVTPTTIYWYFADKDALLVAVLERLLTEALEESAAHADDAWVDQMLWAVERLERYSKLVTVVHARCAISPVIDAWHSDFHSLMDTLLAHGLSRSGVAADDLEAMTRISVFVVEGLLTHPLEPAERRSIIEAVSRPR
ncbi:transcriptional regulator, TetR family [Aeromicrobium marinum DSM 15272]|uniref:Transcriptional regulator, TetR family n=1 Tax=Aeromicrobium marinum DSM 15272 TaxID=585531 RepID=E2S7Y9_9ACTN|nr:TetR/AcrR family transcriptional regulator [Aeromicrobium marinum]EFQ84805.1 transcriptional regulator, TetR family [Aeromicrobium marinum DSM 15272]